jgi:hypothetical protein
MTRSSDNFCNERQFYSHILSFPIFTHVSFFGLLLLVTVPTFISIS